LPLRPLKTSVEGSLEQAEKLRQKQKTSKTAAKPRKTKKTNKKTNKKTTNRPGRPKKRVTLAQIADLFEQLYAPEKKNNADIRSFYRPRNEFIVFHNGSWRTVTWSADRPTTFFSVRVKTHLRAKKFKKGDKGFPFPTVFKANTDPMGLFFGPYTDVAFVDVDQKNKETAKTFRARLLAVRKAFKGRCLVHRRRGGGAHVEIRFQFTIPCDEANKIITDALIRAGLGVAPGVLEVYPTKYDPSAGRTTQGLRLPFGPNAGLYDVKNDRFMFATEWCSFPRFCGNGDLSKDAPTNLEIDLWESLKFARNYWRRNRVHPYQFFAAKTETKEQHNQLKTLTKTETAVINKGINKKTTGTMIKGGFVGASPSLYRWRASGVGPGESNAAKLSLPRLLLLSGVPPMIEALSGEILRFWESGKHTCRAVSAPGGVARLVKDTIHCQ
jgi:hypothetical protein